MAASENLTFEEQIELYYKGIAQGMTWEQTIEHYDANN